MPNQRGRLTEPLARENGTLRPATWDDALDVAAAGRLDRARQTETTRSLGMFSCSKPLTRSTSWHRSSCVP